MLREADALMFLSFHDSIGWAAGEAAATGCPVVSLDLGGPALQAGNNAVVVPARPVGTLARRVGKALALVEGRRSRVHHLDMERLRDLLRELYVATGTGL